MSRGQHISKIILDAGNYITIPRPLARFLGIETACFLMWLVEHDKNVSTEKTSSFYYDASVLKDQTGLSFYQQNKILNDLEEIEVLQIVGRVANNRKKICIDYELLDVLVLFLYSAKKWQEIEDLLISLQEFLVSSTFKNFKKSTFKKFKNTLFKILKSPPSTFKKFKNPYNNKQIINNKKHKILSQTDKVGVGSCDSEKNNSLINDIIPPIKKSKRAGRIKKNNLTNSISFLFPNTTKKLREVYKEISTGTHIPRRETIDKELRRLTKRGIEKKTIIQVYKWYTSHFKEEYTPKIYKAEDLYKKFSRIEEAMNRSSQPDTAPEKPTVMSYDDLDENGKWIYEKLKRASWPKGSISQLPEVIASSLQNLKEVIKINEAIIKEKTFDEALYARPDHNAHRVAWRFKRATRIGACNDFILAWFSEIYEEVSRWEQWSGKLKSYVISIDNERFQVYLKEVLQAFFGSSEQALKGWNLYVEKYRSVKEGM